MKIIQKCIFDSFTHDFTSSYRLIYKECDQAPITVAVFSFTYRAKLFNEPLQRQIEGWLKNYEAGQ
jgi:hypothetical protein